jgi:hypothetical protein
MAGYAALQSHDVKLCRYAFSRAAAFKQHRKAATRALLRINHRPG